MDSKGKTYWRSLGQLTESEDFKEFLHREFPKGTLELAENNWSRRSFLTLMGASLAMAGLAGCRRPEEKIVPYVIRPEEIDPGVANAYATTMPWGSGGCGLVVTCHEGRPTKIEGNELHPSSLGSTNAQVQASILDLYDPDRSQSLLHDGAESTYDDFVAFWLEQGAAFDANSGEGLAILSESFSSLTMARLKKQIVDRYPRAQWVTYDPISDENIYAGLVLATGKNIQPVNHYDRAKVILSLDADILNLESESIAATRSFSESRKVRSQSDDMSRLYAVESSLTVTGMAADHRIRMQSSRVAAYAGALAGELSRQGADIGISGKPIGKDAPGEKELRVIASDLIAAGSGALVVAGARQPAAVHALVASINDVLGSVGQTVTYHEMRDRSLSSTAGLKSLVESMRAGSVSTLIMLGGNPVYNAPVDFKFTSALKKVPQRIHLSSHVDETSQLASWHIPRAHYLESWSDVRAVDGTMSVVQPMIMPLFGSITDLQLMNVISGREVKSAHDLVRESWKDELGKSGFAKKWRRVLHDGLLADSAQRPTVPGIRRNAVVQEFGRVVSPALAAESGLAISFYASTIGDGSKANNGWLQELPDPVTKVAWDNAALISPATAEALSVANGDTVQLAVNGRTLDLAVWISPGQADTEIALPLGYGRTAAGRVGDGVGFDSYRLRAGDHLSFVSGATLTALGGTYEFANTQEHGSMEGRPIVRENTLAGYKDKAEFFPEEIKHPEPLALWDEHSYDEGYQWGMSIDLNTCTGCNACVVACQSENNIPVVGKEQVAMGREMQWIRLDRYYAGDINNPEVALQPMNCQHCENAPCEAVCPVAATVHDKEGLNAMVYNRCIGTRYCSNNCPYKVRRFNFYNFTKELPEIVQMVQNPDVTVRFRGVMEKCTYCVQRITTTKITAKREDRLVADGEIRTACEQACPASAIVFGNINDPNSRVAKLRQNDRKYRVLEELNTRPRTTYLAKLRNPHPDLITETKG